MSFKPRSDTGLSEPEDNVPMIEPVHPLLSIIIPNRERTADLTRCLESIKKQAYKNYEVIIIDDASKEQTVYRHPLFRELSVQVHRQQKSRGAAAAKNLGARVAAGRFLMFLDSDVELLDREVLGSVVRLLEKDDRIGGVGGDLETWRQDEFLLPQRTVSMKTGKVTKTFFDWRNVYLESEVISSCNLTVRKDLFFRLNGFEEIFKTYYEDTDFCLRLRELGYKLITSSRTLAIHHKSASGRKTWRVALLAGRNRTLFVLLHGKPKDLFFLPLREIKAFVKETGFAFCFLLGLIGVFPRLAALSRLKRRRTE